MSTTHGAPPPLQFIGNRLLFTTTSEQATTGLTFHFIKKKPDLNHYLCSQGERISFLEVVVGLGQRRRTKRTKETKIEKNREKIK
jgi:hypothetical protein